MKQDQIADMKEKMYDEYNPNSSRQKKDEPKHKFSLNMAGLATTTHAAGGQLDSGSGRGELLQGFGAQNSGRTMGITPSNAASRAFPGLGVKPGMGLGAASMMSASPMNASQISARFRGIGANVLPQSPTASDVSRAQVDFSKYDPKAMRKKKDLFPERKTLIKKEEDMEIFMTDTTEDP